MYQVYAVLSVIRTVLFGVEQTNAAPLSPGMRDAIVNRSHACPQAHELVEASDPKENDKELPGRLVQVAIASEARALKESGHIVGDCLKTLLRTVYFQP
ncbi:MAG: hypothetical protein U0V56_08645 [Actinomycetota bacterium]